MKFGMSGWIGTEWAIWTRNPLYKVFTALQTCLRPRAKVHVWIELKSAQLIFSICYQAYCMLLSLKKWNLFAKMSYAMGRKGDGNAQPQLWPCKVLVELEVYRDTRLFLPTASSALCVQRSFVTVILWTRMNCRKGACSSTDQVEITVLLALYLTITPYGNLTLSFIPAANWWYVRSSADTRCKPPFCSLSKRNHIMRNISLAAAFFADCHFSPARFKISYYFSCTVLIVSLLHNNTNNKCWKITILSMGL